MLVIECEVALGVVNGVLKTLKHSQTLLYAKSQDPKSQLEVIISGKL